MYKTAIHKAYEHVLRAVNVDPSTYLLNKPLQKEFASISTPEELLSQIQRFGKHIDVITLPFTIKKSEFPEYLRSLAFPILLVSDSDPMSIVVCSPDNKRKFICKEVYKTGEDTFLSRDANAEELLNQNVLHTVDDTSIAVLSFLPNQPVFSDAEAGPGLVKRFTRLLKYERREIGYLLLYAVIAGLISLSLPLGVQSIVSFISSGRIVTSVVVLIVLIIAGLLISGGMQVMQLYLAERIQQKLFTKAAFEFAERIPKIRIESVLKYYPPELVNRFFEIVSLQKGTATILLEFSAAVLQIIFGLLLLSLYHPVFILLSFVLLAMLVVVFKLSGPAGLATSIKESKYKYKVANWLEELARSLITFKLMGNNSIAIQKTDDLVSRYLHARSKHFKILSAQYISFVLFKTLVTGGLLVAGCLLVVNKEISLGQFIASEIVIILIMGAVEKLILKLDTVYDLLTSVDKIGHVTDLPVDQEGLSQVISTEKGIQIKLEDVSYGFPDRDDLVLSGIKLEVKSGERLCIAGSNTSGKTSLIHILLGLLDGWKGRILYDHLPLRSLDKDSLLSQVGSYILQGGLFDGSLLDNIVVGRKITMDQVMHAINSVGLDDYLGGLNQGVHTRLVGGGMRVPGSITRKILLARAIVGEPRILILDDFLLGIEYQEKKRIIEDLISPRHTWTVLIVSNDPLILKRCDRIVFLDNGRIQCEGGYEDIKKHSRFNELVSKENL